MVAQQPVLQREWVLLKEKEAQVAEGSTFDEGEK